MEKNGETLANNVSPGESYPDCSKEFGIWDPKSSKCVSCPSPLVFNMEECQCPPGMYTNPDKMSNDKC